MNNTIRNICLLLLAISLLTASAAAGNGGQTTVTVSYSEVVISADMPVRLIGYTVNGQPDIEKITVLPLDTVVISVNGIPSGMILKTVVTINGENKELTGNPVTLSGFPRDTPTSIPVHLSLEFIANVPDDSPGISGTIPTYTPVPTEAPTPGTHPDTPVTPDVPDDTTKSGWIIPLGLLLVVWFFIILFLILRRKVYRILKSAAKRYGFETERAHLKEIARAVIALLRNREAYPQWRKDLAVSGRLRIDIIRVLDEMGYPAVPRDEVVAEILKAGKGIFTRYLL